jgi:ATP-dependent helicase/DNAse subunit B
MPGLILHTGAQGRYYYFIDRINKLLAGQSDSFIYILPVNRAVRYLGKKLVLNSAGHILIEPQIFTFNSLTRHLYQFLEKPEKIIPRSMRLILISQILQELGPELAYFKNQLPVNSGIANRIDQMLDEFCEFGYQPSDFTQPPPTCQDKYKDFGRILSSLHNKYNDQLLDERGVLGRAVQYLDQKIFRKIFPDVQYIFISGYGIYTPPMLDFIKKVRAWCRVEVKLEYNEQNQELFAHTRQAFNALKVLSSEVIEDSTAGDLIYRYFFKSTVQAKPAHSSARYTAASYTCRELKNKEQEVTFIAATVKNLHLQTGVPLHRFGITFPDLENYAVLIRNVFKDAGLPYNLSTGHALARSALIQSYLQVLKIVTHGFECEQIYELLLSPLISSRDNLAVTWKRLTRQMNMKYLSRDWQQQMRFYIERLKTQPDREEQEADDDYLMALEKMLSCLPPLIDSLQSLPARAAAGPLKEHYVRILSELGMLKWLEDDQNFLKRQEQERLYRAFNRFIKLLEQLTWILKFQWQDREISLSDYYHYLTLLVEQENYSLREWSNYGVQIMPRLEIQALECKYLFIGGLLEGNFPRHFRRDIFFNDQERQQMGLTASEDVLAQDRFLFYQLLTSGAEHIYLTCPRFREDIELLPSTFLTSLREAGVLNGGAQERAESNILTNSTLPEHLSAAFKSGLTDQQQEWFKGWLVVNSLPAAEHWLSGVEIESFQPYPLRRQFGG